MSDGVFPEIMRTALLLISVAALAAACDDRPTATDQAANLAIEPTQLEGALGPASIGSADTATGKFSGRYGGRRGARRVLEAESYAALTASGFFTVSDAPLSTFAADVDTASFTNAHRILRERRRPPADSIRVEEFINACRYDLPTPTGRQTFAVESEVAACPWNTERQLVRFSLSTHAIDKEKLPPCNFVFLIDVSGSMGSANKLGLFQKASDLLIDQLRPQDRVSIVTYASGVRVPLDSVSGDQRGKIRAAVQALRTSGGTNGQGGIQAAYQLAVKNRVQGINRVLLATDGDFNVGIKGADELEGFISERKDQGVFLTVLGFGTGNLKDDRLERLANRGNGAYHYVDTLHTARRVLVEEFGAEMMTVAKDVKLQAEFNKDLVKRYRLLGYENRALNSKEFRDDNKDGGEMGAGHDVTALYEIERVAGAEADAAPLVTLRVRYKPAEGDTSKEVSFELAAPGSGATELSENGRIAATAAALAMQLRDDEHTGAVTTATLSAMSQQLDASRNAELVSLVQTAVAVLDATRDDAVIEPGEFEPGDHER